jgi:hypothetical protein
MIAIESARGLIHTVDPRWSFPGIRLEDRPVS